MAGMSPSAALLLGSPTAAISIATDSSSSPASSSSSSSSTSSSSASTSTSSSSSSSASASARGTGGSAIAGAICPSSSSWSVPCELGPGSGSGSLTSVEVDVDEHKAQSKHVNVHSWDQHLNEQYNDNDNDKDKERVLEQEQDHVQQHNHNHNHKHEHADDCHSHYVALLSGPGPGPATGSESPGPVYHLHSTPPPMKNKHSIRRRDRNYPDVLRDGWCVYLTRSLHKVFLTSWLNLLLLLAPLWLCSWLMHWNDVATLFLGLFCLCPLAERLAAITDELTFYASDALCGLISATMGNLAELIVTIFLILHGMTQVVQLSLIGSILGNLFLVTGCAFLAGGLRYVHQVYNRRAVSTYTTLLYVALMFLCFPFTFSVANSDTAPSETLLNVSRMTSLLMLFAYALLLLYQFRTHSFIFDSEGEEDENGAPVLGLYGAIAWIVIITVIVCVICETVVDSLEAGAKGAGIPPLFIATILLPLFGNVAEHAAAILFAYRNRMDLSLAVSIGSAAQIALFVFPLSVIIGWMAGVPLTLNIGGFETLVVLISVLVGGLLVSTGESDWLRGAMLLIAFLIVCVVFWAQTTPMELRIEFDQELVPDP